jgi:hypothetical protein
MRLVTEDFEIESALPPSQFPTQGREPRRVDPAGAQDETFRALLKLEAIAGLHSEDVQHTGRKSNLALGGDLDQHGVTLLSFLTEKILW